MTSPIEPIFAVYKESVFRLSWPLRLAGTHLELYVVASKPDLKLLSSILILLRPPGVIFFHDFAVFDDALDLGDEEGADAHCVIVNMGFLLSLRKGTDSLCE